MKNSGSFGGLGIVISMRENRLTVVSPIEDSPAFLAGIKSKDVIVRINDESTIGMNLSQAVDRMRGEPGTYVTIYISRNGWSKAKPFKLKRAIIKTKSVSSKLLSDNIAYIKITGFEGNTAEDVKNNLEKLKKEAKKLKGIILDLRNDPGGLLDQSIKVSDIFLKEGYIVSTVGYGRDDKKAFDDGDESDAPMIILTNSGSASASEIVSGALKTNKRALTLGQATFGKGSVQTLMDLGDRTALKLTIAQYLINYDTSIQGIGIKPDIMITPVKLSKDEISYFDQAMYYHESDYDGVLLNKNKALKDQIRNSIRYLFKDDRDEKTKKDEKFFDDNMKFKDDFEIQTAIRLLKSGSSSNSDQLYIEIQDELNKIKKEQDSTISKELEKFNVNWENSKENIDAKDLNIDVKFEKKVVNAGNKLEVKAFVTNNSKKTIYRLRASTESESYFLNGIEFLFGKIEPGKTVFWKSEISIPKDANNQKINLTLKFFKDEKDLNFKRSTIITIKELKKPAYSLTYYIKDANNNNIIEKNEKITLFVELNNTGGQGGETSLTLKNKTSKDLFISKGIQSIKKLPANKTFKTSFEFEIKNNEIKNNEILADLILYDSELKKFKIFDMNFPFKKEYNKKITKKEIMIKFNKDTPLLVKIGESNKVSISGTIAGDIMDYYIFLASNKKLKFDYDKVLFSSNKNKQKTLKFKTNVTLKPGLNTITIVARTSEHFMTSEEILIYNENDVKDLNIVK
jgi:carboxyl-terminal processing protease